MRARSLNGLRVLVGRARRQASALSTGLRALGADVIEIPFIEIRPPGSYSRLDAAVRNLDRYDWLILTSVNGVEAFAARMKRLRLNPQTLKRLKIAAIGPATRDAITTLGLRVAVVPKNYVAESVVESLRKKVKGKSVLLARARIARDVIPRELRKAGARVVVVEAYETVLPVASKEKLHAVLRNSSRRPDVIAFTSSSTVKNFLRLADAPRPAHRLSKSGPYHTTLDGIQLASIGPITSATLRQHGLAVDIEAKTYTIPGLIRAIASAKNP
jgi:uroporphyrinogen-III synthase